MSIPQWKRDRCKWCAGEFPTCEHGVIIRGCEGQYLHGVGEGYKPCTAPTEAEYIAELEAKLDFAHGRYQDLGQVSCDGFTAIAQALGLPTSSTTEQCVETAEELRKDGERLDWASEHLLLISACGTAGLPTGWIVDEYEKDEDGFSGTTLRAALDAARGDKL